MSLVLFKSYLQLILPEYFIITTFSIIAASLLLVNGPSLSLILPIISFSFAMIAFNTLNNITDIEIDRINKPTRPLVTGSITKNQAILFMVFSFAISLISAFLIGMLAFYLALSYLALAILYSVKPFRLRRVLLASNFIGAYLYGAFPYFITFAAISGNFSIIFPAFFFALIFSMAPLKDIEDMNWERITGIKSIPILLGKNNTIKVVILSLFLVNSIMLFCTLNAVAYQKYLAASIISFILLIFLAVFYFRHINETKEIVTQSSLVTATMAVIMLIELIFGISNLLL